MKLTKQQKIDLEFMQIVRKFGNISLYSDGKDAAYLGVGEFGINGKSIDAVIGTAIKYKDQLDKKD